MKLNPAEIQVSYAWAMFLQTPDHQLEAWREFLNNFEKAWTWFLCSKLEESLLIVLERIIERFVSEEAENDKRVLAQGDQE